MTENSAKGKDNPFSFKNFLKINQESESNQMRRHSNEDSDNPFSFRKFLNQGKTSETKTTYNRNADVTVTSVNSTNSSSNNTGNCSYDVDSDLVPELPDFIQDHLELKLDDKTQSNGHLSNSEEHNSIDQEYNGAACGHNTSSPFNSNRFERSSIVNSDNYVLDSYEEISNPLCHNDSEIENKCELTENMSYGGLPDFISGTLPSDTVTIWSSPHSFDNSNVVHSESSNEEEVLKLREENAILHRHLERIKRTSETRIAGLEQQVNDLRDKEAQETATLENMVQQVELNLHITTDRAIKAEGQVTKLKQELKTLQAVLKSTIRENEILNGTRSSIDAETVAEKSHHLASQIKVAADNAEQPLRTLLQGLKHLRLLSSLVADIGKIQEDSN